MGLEPTTAWTTKRPGLCLKASRNAGFALQFHAF
jgi:hypothetical protein